MPNGEEALRFPTLFGEEEAERLRELEKQRKAMAQAYRVKFTPSAWAGVPAPERAVRRVAPPWTTPIVAALPETAETLEYGYTPEQIQERMVEMEEEYKELVRRQTVTNLLPGIQTDIVLSALAGEPILDTSELMSTFPELGRDFTEEEIGYLARLSQTVAQATPEQLMSGELFAYEPSQLPISEEDIEALFREGILDPRFIQATVGFSKDIEGVTQALKDAFPSEVPEDETKEAMREKLEEYFQQRREELGLAEGASREDIAQAHAAEAEDIGQSLVLRNEETGDIYSVQRKADNTVWSEDILVGYYDEEAQQVVPYGFQGQPLKTEEDRENFLKDAWDSLYYGLIQAKQGALAGVDSIWSSFAQLGSAGVPEGGIPIPTPAQWADNEKLQKILPPAIMSIFRLYSQQFSHDIAVAKTIDRINHFNKSNQEFNAMLMERWEVRQQAFVDWAKEHPEVLPDPKYEQSVFDHPELAKDPRWYAHIILSNAPIIGTALFTGLVTTVATGSPVIGAVAGAAVITPVEIGSIYDELISLGASPTNASELATSVGSVIGAVEIMPGILELKAIAPAFMSAFRKVFTKELATLTVKSLTRKGILSTFTKIELAETMEEVIQEAMSNAALKVYNENQSIIEGLDDVAVQTLISVFPLAAMGAGGQYYVMKRNLPPEMQEEIDEVVDRMKEEGLQDDHAEAIALSRVLETETGQAQVERAVDKSVDALGTCYEDAWRFQRQQEEGILVHGSVTGADGKTVKHAWVELGTGYVYEPQTKGFIDKKVFDETFKPVREATYTLEESSIMLAQKGYHGAWADEKTSEQAVAPAKITKLEERLRGYISQTETVIDSLRIQEKRVHNIDLTSSERLSAKGAVISLQEQLDELDKNRKAILKKIDKARGELEAAVTPVPITPAEEPSVAQPLITEGEQLVSQAEEVAPDNPDVIAFRKALEKAKTVKTSKALRNNLIKMEALEDKVRAVVAKARISVDSVVRKIRTNQRLSAEETLFYNNNIKEIEERLSEPSRPLTREEALRRMEEESPEAAGIFRRISIPDLSYLPSEALPRLEDLEEEIIKFNRVLEGNPSLKALIRGNEEAKSLQDRAASEITNLRAEIEFALEAKDEGWKDYVKERENKLKDVAKRAGLRAKTLLTSGWGDLSDLDRIKVALSFVDDHSVSSGVVDDFRDTVLVLSSMEDAMAGLPFLRVFERIENVRGYCQRLQDEYFKKLTEVPRWRKIVRNKEKMEQVALIIDSRRPGSKTTVSPAETEEGMLMVEVADAMESTYRDWQPIVRFQRFTEAYESTKDVVALQDRFKDAPPEDIQKAKEVLETGGEDSLWRFLYDKDWGVYKSGYSPWRISNPTLEREEPSWSAVRGASYLMSRDSTEMPWEAKRGVLATYDSYNLSMALRFFLRNEIRNLAELFDVSWDKWTNPEHVQSYLRKYLRAVQGFPEEENIFFMRIMRKLLSWAYPNIFWHPFIGLRNIIQFAWSFPYRTELIRGIWEYDRLPPTLRVGATERFATTIDQSGRPLRNWMFRDEQVSVLGEVPPWVSKITGALGYATKPLDFLANQTAKIPTIAFTDKASRAASYKAALTKSWRATEQYKKDKNVKKWFNDSGINNGYISRRQQEHILGLLGLEDRTISWSVPGLQEIPGYEAAAIRIAEETTQRTLYLYDKAVAAGVHRGAGRALASLFTFPRSTIQMYGQQLARVLSKESTASERFAAAKNILLLWIVGEMMSHAFMLASGRRRKEYSFFGTVTWSFGGLGVGIATDLFDFLSDISLAIGGTEEDKKRVLSRLPTEAARLGDVLVGFYGIIMDTLEAATAEEQGIDIRFLRKIRAFFDKNYTPEEVEKAERSAVEMVQKILAKADPPDPTAFEAAQEALIEAEDKLGTMNMEGRYFTLRDLGSKIESVYKELPDYLFIPESGFSELTLFYIGCMEAWLSLEEIPANDTAARSRGMQTRTEWREQHPLEEAMLLFWEKYSKSVLVRGTEEAEQVESLLRLWFDLYSIDRTMHGLWATFQLPVEIPFEE